VSAADEVLAANVEYAESFAAQSMLDATPARHFAILTCMDARLDPARFAGLAEGDAHVVRNAGGRASDDAIRSLVMSYSLLGTTEWLVVHHTECGLRGVTNEDVCEVLAARDDVPDASVARHIDWLPLGDIDSGVVEDVERLRQHPLVPGSIAISGWVYDVRSRRLRAVPGAGRK
jgi:carbonic anhydrase